MLGNPESVRLFAGQPEFIICEALRALGIELSFVYSLLNFAPEDTLSRLSADQISIFEWMRICKVLCLDPKVFHLGYNSHEHRIALRAAIKSRQLELPRTHSLYVFLAFDVESDSAS